MIKKSVILLLASVVMLGSLAFSASANSANIIRANMLLTGYFADHFGMSSDRPGGVPGDVAIPILEVFDAHGQPLLFVAGQKQVNATLATLPGSLQTLAPIKGYQQSSAVLKLMKGEDGKPLDISRLDGSVPTLVYVGATACSFCVRTHANLLELLHKHPELRANVLDVTLECRSCHKPG